MNTIRKLRSPWVIVTLLLAMYVGSYFAVSDYYRVSSNLAALRPFPNARGWSHRLFKHQWMVDFYWPMAYIESKVRGRTVIATYHQSAD